MLPFLQPDTRLYHQNERLKFWVNYALNATCIIEHRIILSSVPMFSHGQISVLSRSYMIRNSSDGTNKSYHEDACSTSIQQLSVKPQDIVLPCIRAT